MSEGPDPPPAPSPALSAPPGPPPDDGGAGAWPHLLAASGHLLAVKDAADGRYLELGPALGALFGLEHEQCLGRTDTEIFGAALGTAWRAADQMAAARVQAVVGEHAFEWRSQWREFVVARQFVRAPGGRALLLSHWVDVRAERQRGRQLAEALAALQQARAEIDALRQGGTAGADLRDPVSGLAGPQPFLAQLRREADLSQREAREMSVILLEVEVAPGLPPAEAAAQLDAAARVVGTWLRAGTRTMDATSRLGPTRFAVLMSGAGLPIAARRAEALLSARREPSASAVELPGQAPRAPAFDVSLGVASYPLSADAPASLLAAAEGALHRARARGGNQVSLAGLSLEKIGGAGAG